MELEIVFVDEMIPQQDGNGDKVLFQFHIRGKFIYDILKRRFFEHVIHFGLKVKILSQTQKNAWLDAKIPVCEFLIIRHIASHFYA